MYLLDSDAARKLCQYQLVHELANALQCSLRNFAVLPQLKFQLRLTNRKAALKKLGSEQAVVLALELTQKAQTVDVHIEHSNELLSLDRPDIDSGEAVLFAALIQNAQARMISGDKRAYVALSRIDGHPSLDPLWVRLICLEEAIALLVENGNFEQISIKVRARPDVDRALNLAFGHSAPAERCSVIAALASYINGLKQDTSNKFRDPLEKQFGLVRDAPMLPA